MEATQTVTRESTLIKRALVSKGYDVLRIKRAYREDHYLVTLHTWQAATTPRLPGEMMAREFAYGFQGRITTRTWLKIDGPALLASAWAIPVAVQAVQS